MQSQGKKRAMGSHQSTSAITHVWLTPKWILDDLGPFKLDPCAAPDPKPWPTAEIHYTAPNQDGLALPWFGRVWCNPPYGNAAASWLRRLAQHGQGTALIFARTETKAFADWVFEQADALLFLEKRLHFCDRQGEPAKRNSGAPSVLVAYGAKDAEILLDGGLTGRLRGAVMGLKRPVLLYMAFRDRSPAVESPKVRQSWRDAVLAAVSACGGSAKLSDLYRALEGSINAKENPHWREKIRQTVARVGLKKVSAGQYALAL